MNFLFFSWLEVTSCKRLRTPIDLRIYTGIRKTEIRLLANITELDYSLLMVHNLVLLKSYQV